MPLLVQLNVLVLRLRVGGAGRARVAGPRCKGRRAADAFSFAPSAASSVASALRAGRTMMADGCSGRARRASAAAAATVGRHVPQTHRKSLVGGDTRAELADFASPRVVCWARAAHSLTAFSITPSPGVRRDHLCSWRASDSAFLSRQPALAHAHPGDTCRAAQRVQQRDATRPLRR